MAARRKGAKVKSARKGKGKRKAKVKKKTRFFSYAIEGKAGDPIDLSKKPLTIKLIEPFKKAGEASTKFSLSIWEKKMKGERNRSYEVFTVELEARESGGAWDVSVVELKQDEEKFPKRKSAGAHELWLPARLDLTDKDGTTLKGGKGLEFVLPPLEFDGVLELQLGSSIGQAVCGLAHVTWSSFEAMMGSDKPTDKSGGVTIDGTATGRVVRGRTQRGSLRAVVVHCMAASQVAKPSKAFDVDQNVKILVDYRVSAHFIIGRDGKIAQLVDIARGASHAPGENTRSIGIELLGFHDKARERLEKIYADHAALEADRDAVEKRCDEHKAAKAAGTKKVEVARKKVDVDKAIEKCEKGIAKLEKQIEKFEKKYEKTFDVAEWKALTKEKDANDVPRAFLYTEKQYAALGGLLVQVGRRFGYERVRSHHSVSPRRKWDPGSYFDWSELTPYLLPGKLKGDEKGDGGYYTVD
ncbi:MAG: N-acetylmuramoyl-L-alanine amidase [Myxococcota bacterium]